MNESIQDHLQVLSELPSFLGVLCQSQTSAPVMSSSRDTQRCIFCLFGKAMEKTRRSQIKPKTLEPSHTSIKRTWRWTAAPAKPVCKHWGLPWTHELSSNLSSRLRCSAAPSLQLDQIYTKKEGCQTQSYDHFSNQWISQMTMWSSGKTESKHLSHSHYLSILLKVFNGHFAK